MSYISLGQGGQKIMGELNEREKEILGDIGAVMESMKEFRVNAKLLASSRVVRKYRGQWVGIAKGQVAASGKTLKAVLAATDARGLERGTLAVGFIDLQDRILLV
jgi:hypothetical protein